jgi:hypothetical protein
MNMQHRQAGAFLMGQPILVIGVLLGVLIVPLWMKKERDEKAAAKLAASAARKRPVPAIRTPAASAPVASASAASSAPVESGLPSLGFGLSFALAGDGKTMPDVAQLSCSGEPRELDQPLKEACNPQQGDTSCRTVLPVLCIKPAGLPLPAGVEAGQGWTGGMLGATQPVMGAVLSSEAVASARCEKELGAGWRMAGTHDAPEAQGLQQLQGQRTTGLSTRTRFWVQVRDQKANCWNSSR